MMNGLSIRNKAWELDFTTVIDAFMEKTPGYFFFKPWMFMIIVLPIIDYIIHLNYECQSCLQQSVLFLQSIYDTGYLYSSYF